MLKNSDDQSPTDLVEQLFQGQQIDGVKTSSAGRSSMEWSWHIGWSGNPTQYKHCVPTFKIK
jgi:hypothetical protein